jgi:hypothetical protein
VNDCVVKIVVGEPTPLQLACWKKLWSMLLSPAPVSATGTGPKDARESDALIATVHDHYSTSSE